MLWRRLSENAPLVNVFKLISLVPFKDVENIKNRCVFTVNDAYT